MLRLRRSCSAAPPTAPPAAAAAAMKSACCCCSSKITGTALGAPVGSSPGSASVAAAGPPASRGEEAGAEASGKTSPCRSFRAPSRISPSRVETPSRVPSEIALDGAEPNGGGPIEPADGGGTSTPAASSRERACSVICSLSSRFKLAALPLPETRPLKTVCCFAAATVCRPCTLSFAVDAMSVSVASDLIGSMKVSRLDGPQDHGVAWPRTPRSRGSRLYMASARAGQARTERAWPERFE